MVICAFLELSRTFAWRHRKNASIVSFVIVGNILNSVYQEIELLTRMLFNPHKAFREITFLRLHLPHFSSSLSSFQTWREWKIASISYLFYATLHCFPNANNGEWHLQNNLLSRHLCVNLVYKWIIAHEAFDKRNWWKQEWDDNNLRSIENASAASSARH